MILGVIHAAMAKRVGANLARSAGQLGIVLCRGAKNFSRIRNPDTRRFEQGGFVWANGIVAALFAAIRWPHGVALQLFGAPDQAKQISNGNAR